MHIVSAAVFEGQAKNAIIALKYRNERHMAKRLARALCPLLPDDVDVVTWAPTAEARRMRRGVDQAELIARHLAAFSGLPAAPMLRRIGSTRQTGHSGNERRRGPLFVASPACAGVRLVLIDDVVTTGATLLAAAAAAYRAGALSVHAVTVAAVP